MSLPSPNLDLWLLVQQTDPKYTKEFNRGGGFKGTAINPTWLAKKATEAFGPCGIGWGLDILKEQLIEGPSAYNEAGQKVATETIHTVLVQLWYVHGGKTGKVIQYGQTTMVGKNKYGWFTDEEAPKKSLTDAMSKCLSLLGFASDVHMGLFDDNKYVNEASKAVAEQQINDTYELLSARFDKAETMEEFEKIYEDAKKFVATLTDKGLKNALIAKKSAALARLQPKQEAA